jgi:5-methylcytosine-specific restriction protein B
MKTLTNITPYTDYVEKLNSLFDTGDIDDVEKEEIEYPVYDEEKFLSEVYMDKQQYDTLTGLIRNKKNVILQGAPGVGKTFAAKRLAYSMMGVMDKERVMMVQFHQSYSYEDFIMGFRPTETGFTLKKGAFYDFCKAAEIDSENDYFFIIDEINRGNLSKIFGELFMLIEPDKRGNELQLLYSGEKFNVPRNIYIVGLMNTADRSIAMIDYALRRRFVFFDMQPGFESEGFIKYMESFGAPKFISLINSVKELNQAITDDAALGAGFCVGHSYFSNLKSADDETLSNIVEYEMVPLLQEYWFDSPETVALWTEKLRNSIA